VHSEAENPVSEGVRESASALVACKLADDDILFVLALFWRQRAACIPLRVLIQKEKGECGARESSRRKKESVRPGQHGAGPALSLACKCKLQPLRECEARATLDCVQSLNPNNES